MNHLELGVKGEDLAFHFLVNLGYQLKAKNYRFKHLELDLIFENKGELIVVEVKTRSNAAFGEPYTFVTTAKQKQIIKATEHYIHEIDWHGETRIDIVSILYHHDFQKIEHIPHAFYPC